MTNDNTSGVRASNWTLATGTIPGARFPGLVAPASAASHRASDSNS